MNVSPKELAVIALTHLISQPVHADVILPSKTAPFLRDLEKPVIMHAAACAGNAFKTRQLYAGKPRWTADKPLLVTAWQVWPGLQRCEGV